MQKQRGPQSPKAIVQAQMHGRYRVAQNDPLTPADVALAHSFGGRFTEADIVGSDRAFHDAKVSGELDRERQRRAVEHQQNMLRQLQGGGW